jgi:hypothetical protein
VGLSATFSELIILTLDEQFSHPSIFTYSTLFVLEFFQVNQKESSKKAADTPVYPVEGTCHAFGLVFKNSMLEPFILK